METNAFSVKEFSTIYSVIEDNSSKFSSRTNQVMSLCEQLSQLIKSTDSGLSNSYTKLSGTLSVAKNKVIDLLNQLEIEMKNYESRTLKNEEEAETKINGINTTIDDIAAVFNNIAGKNV